MCTCFIYRGKDALIAMNYDNYGNNLKLAEYNSSLFLMTINLQGEERPLFGVRSNGVFANQQFVDECEAGKYMEGDNVVDTIGVVEKVLYEEVCIECLGDFLNSHKIVSPLNINAYSADINTPNFNVHSMLGNIKGDCYIVEPGRGILKFDSKERFIVMSNCSLCEAKQNNIYQGFGSDRQLKVEKMLQQASEDFNVEEAFRILKSVELNKLYDVISTEFSFVYSANQNVVYYCYNREFNNIHRYQLLK